MRTSSACRKPFWTLRNFKRSARSTVAGPGRNGGYRGPVGGDDVGPRGAEVPVRGAVSCRSLRRANSLTPRLSPVMVVATMLSTFVPPPIVGLFS